MTDHQNILNDMLKTAINAAVTDTTMIRNKGNFIYLNVPGEIASLNNNNMELLEDKLHLLKYNTPNKMMIVSFLYLDNNKLYDDIQISEMAKIAIQNNNNLIGSKEIVYVVVPYSNYESMFGVLLFNTDVCYNIGYAESKPNLVENNNIHEGSIYNSIIKIFKMIKKPLFVRQFFIKADGQVVETIAKETNVRGYNAINVLKIYKSKYIDSTQQLRLNALNYFLSLPENPTEQQMNEYIDKYELIAEKYDEASEMEDITESNIWKPFQIEDKLKYREVYILDYEIGKAFFGKATSSFQLAENWQIYWETSLLNSEHFYDFNGLVVLDPIIYGIADIAGMVSCCYIDSIGDSLGLAYATFRGNNVDAGFYAFALPLPIGAAYLKSGSNAGEAFFIVGKKLDNGEVEFLLKKKNQITTGEEILSSPLTDKNGPANQVLDDINNDTQVKQKMAKHFDDIANIGRDFFNFLDTAENWNEQMKQVFKQEYMQGSDGFKTLFNVNNSLKLKRANAWKILKEAFPNRSFCN